VTENISLHVRNGKLIERDLVSGQYISLQAYHGYQKDL
jgi:hypothetical protein